MQLQHYVHMHDDTFTMLYCLTVVIIIMLCVYFWVVVGGGGIILSTPPSAVTLIIHCRNDNFLKVLT